MTQVTTDCFIFFRSKAYCYEALLNAWKKWVVRQGNAFEVSGRKILLGDHTAAVKDGRRMPGVVSMHESSETQSKPDYFRGQCWGADRLIDRLIIGLFLLPFTAGNPTKLGAPGIDG